MINSNWKRVSRNEPCPICQHDSWCMVSADGAVCICQRVESDHPTKNSGGWVHRLRDEKVEKAAGGGEEGGGVRCRCTVVGAFSDAARAPRLRLGVASTSVAERPTPLEPRQLHHTSTSIAQYFAALPTSWHNAQARMCARLERDLGLPAPILEVLDWRWDRAVHAVAIPMRDAGGEVTGIRYRSLENGSKWSKRGSKDGLFFDPEFIPYDPEELVICEGPTDCAAAMACGFWCVGRSSCGTGRDALRELIRFRAVKRVTIVADDDKPKPRPGGGTWRPGLEGAQRLASALGCAYRIVLPPPGFKDLREWYRAGTLNEVSFKAMCQTADWRIG